MCICDRTLLFPPNVFLFRCDSKFVLCFVLPCFLVIMAAARTAILAYFEDELDIEDQDIHDALARAGLNNMATLH